MKKIIELGNLNYSRYKHLSKNIVLNIVICSVMFLLITSFGISVSNLYSNILNDNYEIKEIFIKPTLQDGTRKKITVDDLNKLNLINGVDSINSKYSIYARNLIKVQLNDIDLTCSYLDGVDVQFSPFSNKFIIDRGVNPDSKYILSGNSFKAKDKKKALLDENYAYILGFNNLDDAIGKKINLDVNGFLVSDIEIVGVFDYKLGTLHSDGSKEYISNEERKMIIEENNATSPLILSSDVTNMVLNSNPFLDMKYSGQIGVSLFVDSVTNIPNICDTISKILPNDIFSEVNDVEKTIKTINAIKLFVTIISIIILIVAILSVINTLIIKIGLQENLLRLMIKMGYRTKDIILINQFEMLRFFLKSLIISFVIVISASLLFDMALSPSYSKISTFNKFLFIINPTLFFSYFVGLFVLLAGVVALASYFQLRKNKIIYKVNNGKKCN